MRLLFITSFLAIVISTPIPDPDPNPNPNPNLLWYNSLPQPTSTEKFTLSKNVIAPNNPAQPDFPTSIPSCQKCQSYYPQLSDCLGAATALANTSIVSIMWNIPSYLNILKCACSDSFNSGYPQCEDCFIQTNQSNTYLQTDVPASIQSIRNLCGSVSSVLGNVSNSNGQVPTSTPTSSAIPTPTSTTSNAVIISTSLFWISLCIFVQFLI